jgi:hypothetical protein
MYFVHGFVLEEADRAAYAGVRTLAAARTRGPVSVYVLPHETTFLVATLSACAATCAGKRIIAAAVVQSAAAEIWQGPVVGIM